MGYSLEALIVVPATIVLFTSIINFSVKTYDRSEAKSRIEIEAINYMHEDKKVWSNKIFHENEYDEWSFVTAINPVKIKKSVDLMIDMFGTVTKQIFLIPDEYE